MKRNILIFDFDGVVANSIEETLLISYMAGKNLSAPCDIPDDYKKLFLEYRYLVGPAYQYNFLFTAINKRLSSLDVDIVEEFEKQRSNSTADFNELYASTFFSTREILINNYKDQWIQLLPPFDQVVHYLKNESKKNNDIYVSSTKDMNSISTFFETFEIEIPKDRIKTKELSNDKQVHMNHIKEQSGVNFEDMHFIDDSIKHLINVDKLNVNVYLSSWGYNHPTDLPVRCKKLSLADFETSDPFQLG